MIWLKNIIKVIKGLFHKKIHKRMYYLHHIKETEIIYPLFSAKEKIPCILQEYYGSHLPPEKNRGNYFYCYENRIIPKKAS